jgi:hypothetical protein
MSDINKVDETVNSNVGETEVVETKTEEKDGRGFFGKVYDKMFPAKDDSDEATDDGTEDEVNKKAEEPGEAEEPGDEIEIDDELYQAAKAKGWDDEKIAKYFQEDKSVLEALVPAKTEVVKASEEKVAKEEVKGLEKMAITPESMTALKDQYGAEVIDQVVTPLIEKLNQTIDIVNSQSAETKQVAETISKQAMASQVQGFQKEMDKLGKEYDVFGAWENVPRDKDGLVNKNNPVLKARDEVWQSARKFQQLGSDWSTAVDDAVSLYKGKHLEKMTHSKIIKDLDKRKVKFTPRPTSKKVEAAPPSGDAAKIAVINKGLKVIGKEV